MTAVDGEEPVGRQPAPEPARTLRFRVSGGHVLRGDALRTTARAADGTDAEGAPAVVPGEPAALPATLGPVQLLLDALPRQHRPAPEPAPLPSRRHRPHPPLPRQRPWYARPVPAVLAVGGLVTVTATGLAEGLAPGAPAGIPAPRSTGSTLRGALLVPPPAAPTPAEVPARTVTVAPAPRTAPTSAAAEQVTPSPDRTTRPKRTRKPRRTRTAKPSGTDRSGTGSATPTPDPTGQVTIGPP